MISLASLSLRNGASRLGELDGAAAGNTWQITGRGLFHGSSMKLSRVFPDLRKINTQCEVRRTLEFTIEATSYRLEVLYCYSNPKSRWTAQAYFEKNGTWKSVPNFPWRGEKNEEAAIRTGLRFLEELHP
jgi:hypothetical protein